MLSVAHAAAPGTQALAVMSHFSAPLQKNESAHFASFATNAHAFAASSQESSVHVMSSAHTGGSPDTHPNDASHFSAPLQYRPSSHPESSGVNLQALVASSQTSVVHVWESAQTIGVPAWQPVSVHISTPLQ